MMRHRTEDATRATGARAWQLAVDQPDPTTLRVGLTGAWRLDAGLPSPAEVRERAAAVPGLQRMALDGAGITAWDSGLLTFLMRVAADNAQAGIATDPAGLPPGVRRLLALATAVKRRDTGGPKARPSWLAQVGLATLRAGAEAQGMLAFLGTMVLAV